MFLEMLYYWFSAKLCVTNLYVFFCSTKQNHKLIVSIDIRWKTFVNGNFAKSFNIIALDSELKAAMFLEKTPWTRLKPQVQLSLNLIKILIKTLYLKQRKKLVIFVLLNEISYKKATIKMYSIWLRKTSTANLFFANSSITILIKNSSLFSLFMIRNCFWKCFHINSSLFSVLLCQLPFKLANTTSSKSLNETWISSIFLSAKLMYRAINQVQVVIAQSWVTGLELSNRKSSLQASQANQFKRLKTFSQNNSHYSVLFNYREHKKGRKTSINITLITLFQKHSFWLKCFRQTFGF